MKKKFFTAALTTALSVSAIISVSAQPSDITIDAAFSASTEDKVLHQYDFNAEYTFHTKSNGTNNWDNFILELRTEDNVGKTQEGEEAPVYIDLRADNFGWLANQTDDAKLVWGELPEGFTWDNYLTDMQAGMDCSIFIKRRDNTFIITINEEEKYIFEAEVTVNDFEGQRTIMHLTGEKCELTNIQFTDYTASAPPAFGDSTSDVTIGPAFSANTGDEVIDSTSYADVAYRFHNQSTGTNNWDNFILEIRTQGNVGKTQEGEEAPVYIDLRADNFGWLANQTDETAALVWEEVPEGFTWDDYAADMQAGMDCTVNISRRENTFTIEINEGNKYFFKAETTVNDFQGQKAVIHLTGENCILSDVKLGHSVIHIPTDPTDPTDPTNPAEPTDPTNPAEPDTKNPSDSEVKEPTKVSVGDKELKATVSKDNAPEGATITVAEVTDKAEIEKAEKAIKAKFTEVIRKYVVLDINMMVGSEKKQPLNNGKVLVTLDIPSTLDAVKVAVYRMEEDGSLTELKSTVKDNAVSFETDHFSSYVIAEKAVSSVEPTTTKADETTTAKEKETTTTKTTATKTGDVAPIAVLIAVAAAACTAVVVSRKRTVK